MRGNRLFLEHQTHDVGSIPACAGEPGLGIQLLSAERVYPRVCGGTIYESRHVVEGKGLSPRVRGNPPEAAAGRSQQGSIPACAGEP